MPASALGWTIPKETQLFQMYGTKRKIDLSSSNTLHDDDLPAKRLRNESEELDLHPDCDRGHQVCKTWNSVKMQSDLAVISSWPENNNNLTCLRAEDPLPPWPSDRVSPQSESEQVDQVMELDSPCKSCAQNIPETEQSSVFVHREPEEEQSSVFVQHEPDTVTKMDSQFNFQSSPQETSYSHNHEIFCKDFCGCGESSPTSGRVRCFCRPSWEGMYDRGAFVSDIY